MDILTLIRQKSETQPGQTAFSGTEKGDSITYRELMARADKVAAELHQRGCRKSERCGLIMADGAEFLVSALGILGAGLCLVPIATFLPDEEKDFVIKAAGLHWLFQRDDGLFRLPFAQPVDGQDDEEFRACNPAYIRFTSGTTGRRKGILLGQEAIIDRLNSANTVLQIDSTDRIWFALPMADHFIVSMLLYLSRGATVLGLSKARELAHHRPALSTYRGLRLSRFLPGADRLRRRGARFSAAGNLHDNPSPTPACGQFCAPFQKKSEPRFGYY